MSQLFDDVDANGKIRFETNNEYAKQYRTWRQKELLNKVKTKYGDINIDNSGTDSSSTEDDDEDEVEISEEMEKNFYKTLSKLKSKDPSIYDSNVKFFDDTPVNTSVKKKKDVKNAIYLKDYEANILLNNDDIKEEENDSPRSPTFVQEQNMLRKNLKEALSDVDEPQDCGWGGMFRTRQKTQDEINKDEADYILWLKGQQSHLSSNEEKNLAPLKNYWNDPNLLYKEKFLRDYVLNNQFSNLNSKSNILTYEEVVNDAVSDDQSDVEKQEEFEHKFNNRFEEADQEFIKRYPRTMVNSVRRGDDRRKIKRAETKVRKHLEKLEKMEEIGKLKEMKRQEIKEKIKKLQEITGNVKVAFDEQDIDGDFDPEEHDKRMQALFNSEFYASQKEDEKPEFPDLDEELEIERWDEYEGEEITDVDQDDEPHCEDDNFNMDCDPSTSQEELMENSKDRKKKRRKSKFAAALSKPKPIFDPDEKKFEEYFDEYYNLDCEDVIGDMPCRFKYRKVVPNSFGLTVEEILRADDKELNSWCSIKKATQHRPDHIEKYDQIAYGKKGLNEGLKRKVLPSLYMEEEKVEKVVGKNSVKSDSFDISKKKDTVPKQINKNKATFTSPERESTIKKSEKRKHMLNEEVSKKVKPKKPKQSLNQSSSLSDARLHAFGLNPKKLKNKFKYGKN